MKNYSEMTSDELLNELEAWNAVVREPKGPGSASNSAREAAATEMAKIEAWIARKRLWWE